MPFSEGRGRVPKRPVGPAALVFVVLSLCSVLLSRIDLNAAPSRTQDSGWLLVLLALRAFGMWGVVCVVQQQQNRRPASVGGRRDYYL
jgi:hypothetical protein